MKNLKVFFLLVITCLLFLFGRDCLCIYFQGQELIDYSKEIESVIEQGENPKHNIKEGYIYQVINKTEDRIEFSLSKELNLAFRKGKTQKVVIEVCLNNYK